MNRDNLDILLGEIKSFREYMFHLEKQMLQVLIFYSSLFTFLVMATVSIFYYFYVLHPQDLVTTYAVMIVLSAFVFSLGCYLMMMFLELRIRKIKVLEQIARTTEEFNSYEEFKRSNIMISTMAECPSYLRRPSSEWFSVIYMSTINALFFCSFLFFGNRLYLASNPVVLNVSEFAFLPVWFVCVLLFQFGWSTLYCYYYDKKREITLGIPPKYQLLSRDVPFLIKPFDFVALNVEKLFSSRIERRLMKQGAASGGEDRAKDALCVFCDPKVDKTLLFATKHFIVKYDDFPVSKGHLLVIPRKHFENLDDLPARHARELRRAVLRSMFFLRESYKSEGFNIGINVGSVAGQTVRHLHVHVIPRYRGDTANPEGGIRNILGGGRQDHGKPEGPGI